MFCPVNRGPPEVKEQKKQNKKKENSFREIITQFIEYVQKEPPQKYGILNVCEKFKFQRRRFYDLLNVLDALGATKKQNVDEFEWYGISKIKSTLEDIVAKRDVFNPEKSLEQIIPTDKSIVISRLTIAFLLCYIALQEDCLSIQTIATFLSRDNNRFKSTLCKLYQVSHILVPLGVIEKKSTPSEFSLSSPYKDNWCRAREISNKGEIGVPTFIQARRLSFNLSKTQVPAAETTVSTESE